MEVKGILITSTRDYLKKKFGVAMWNEFVETLPKGIREKADKLLLPGGMYDSEIYVKLSLEADKFFGEGDGKLLEEIGAATADQSIELYHSIFKRKLKTPQEAITGLVPLLAKMLFEEMESEEIKVEDGYVMFKLKGPSLHDPDFAEVLARRSIGWMKEILSLVGVILKNSNFDYNDDSLNPYLKFEFWWE